MAVKKINNFLSSAEMAQRCYRELKLLKALKVFSQTTYSKVNPYLAQFVQAHIQGNDLYIVTEYVPSNLHAVMKDYGEVLPREVIRRIAHQLLSALCFLHELGIAHRDLKPENVLINPNTLELQLCDLGLARSMKDDMEDLTGYVTTRSYRAPEVMLTWRGYGLPMDLWSLGCIFAEMLTGRVLFPARDNIQHLAMMIDLLGVPPAKCLPFSLNPQLLLMHSNERNILAKDLREHFGSGDLMVQLIERMLKFDPSERITAREALACFEEAVSIKCPELNELDLELTLTLAQWREQFLKEVNV